jgi:NRPS condensation-like uncharacterized protein
MIVVAAASSAQVRVWLEERIHYNCNKPTTALHNMVFLYHLYPGHTLSIQRLRQALQLIIIKHQSLRTSLILDQQNNQLTQKIIGFNNNKNNLFTFVKSTFKTDEQLKNIMHDERQNFQHFDLAQGLVFRCHLLYHKRISSHDLLSDKDTIVFNFHHAMFDIPSMDMFIHDLNQAYTTGQLDNDENATLRYIDCKYQ